MKTLHTLKAAAVDLDGVLVTDTFSPVIKVLVEAHGGVYDREVERNVFSQNRQDAARYLIGRMRLSISETDFIGEYFRTRETWIAANGEGLRDGAEDFLGVLSDAGLRLVCYGGLPEAHFTQALGTLAKRFETYVCTNGFRPGVAEITHGTLVLDPRSVVFFDDVSRVAEAARAVGCPFVGVPSSLPWGYQRGDMQTAGVTDLLSSLSQLTAGLLDDLDARAGAGFWRTT